MHRRSILAALLVLLCLSTLVRADGFIVIHDGPVIPHHFAFAPLEVTYHRVNVDVDDQVATTSVDEEFYNRNEQVLEGTYIFPLPVGAHIDKFAMDIDGKAVEAEMLSAEKAKSIYEEIVRKSRDPALMEYAGRDALRVRIFPIEANGRKHITLKYTQLLTADSGLTEYVYPLNTEKFSSALIDDVSVTVKLHCSQPIKNLYCPSHNVSIRRDGEHAATVSYSENHARPDTDFKLVYTRSADDIGISLLTYKAVGEDGGYFMLLASPGLAAPEKKVQPKDICFVLDTSGSMAGPKLEQAKRALRFCLNNLNEGDGFEMIRFSTEAEPLFGSLKPAKKENVDAALKFVDDLKATGGTAIDEALTKALAPGARSADRPYLIMFLTDGRPTIGTTDEDTLVANATNGNTPAHVFCFGIGNDVNTHLLDRIADGTRAASAYVGDTEDIEVKVSTLYSKIREPALTDVAVTFDAKAIRTSQLYPSRMPDLFKGEMLVAFGKYSGNGDGSVKIAGSLNGQHREFVSDVKFTDKDTSRQFIPRLWATRRIGWLLDEIRLHGESAELKDEATRLARQWGIVTPYTAYLIMEDEQKRNVPLTMQSMRQMNADTGAREMAGNYYKSVDSEARDDRQRSGSQALANASRLGSLKSGENEQYAKQSDGLSLQGAAAPVPSASGRPTFGYREATNYAQQVKLVNGRSFYQNGTVWLDGTIQSNQNLKTSQVKFNSDEYFALLKEHSDAAAWFALGSEVDVVIGDTLYCVRED